MDVALILKILFSALFVVGGVLHFVIPGVYLKIMPPYVPYHRACVAVSGVAEIVLGLLLFVPALTQLAGWGLILLLIAVFPANIQMLYNARDGSVGQRLGLWVRLPAQGLLIYWAYLLTK